jgi:hypothetical protein
MMTAYFHPQSRTRSRPAPKDPLFAAREKLREAARLPFESSQPNSWQEMFIQVVEEARIDLRRHIWMAGLSDSPLSEAEREEPRLLPHVDHQRREQDELAENIDALIAAVGGHTVADIWKMIELGERAILLEMAIARHQNRLSELLFETTHRDVGIAG